MRPAALLFLGLLLITCGDGTNVIGPNNQLQVTNATDDFQLQVTNLNNVSQGLRYRWTNTGDSATVNQASAIAGGSATLTIRGPDSVMVYQSDLIGNGTFETGLSTTGSWYIELRLHKADGDVNFRVQRAP